MNWKADLRIGAAGVLALASACSAKAVAGDPDALWKIVHGLCAPNAAATGNPAPCLEVNAAEGDAVLKDKRGVTQVLVIPTTKVTGIESPDILAPTAPNYWQTAWRARHYDQTFAGKPMPRDDVALAVNSEFGRSQNQLHIHVDCVAPDVKAALARDAARIGPQWADLGEDLAGHRYEAMSLPGADLGANNPFKLLAAGDPTARADMSRETLVVVGVVSASGAPGFILLADRADPATADIGAGESLMDHTCAVLNTPG